ncbi:cytochrome P450 [Pseudonocardia spinosispora]|uniref:cytochrome P450 n=1 Tax=Pseudonocardia spinosispora TaxID=103441 RepID=UPI0003FF4B3F|nr:cytochrome P450 [Pseudonocardia spinosispora]
MIRLGLPFGDPSFLIDPYPTYAQLRREAPVWWADDVSAWIVSRYEDICSILRNPETFSSARPWAGPDYDRNSGVLIVTDPPRHRPERHKFTGAGSFSARTAHAWKRRVESICLNTVSTLSTDTFDAVTDVALPSAVQLFTEYFDLPEPRRGTARWQDGILPFYHPGTSSMMPSILDYLKELVAARRRDPDGDPISAAVLANEASRTLSDEQLAWNFYDAILAGASSTAAVAAESIGLLAEHPDAQDPIHWTSPTAIERSVNELLRYAGHIHRVARIARRDVHLAGQLIRQGDTVHVLLASAHRDEAAWERADQLDLSRPMTPINLAFGHGPHMSPGATLARTFMIVLLPTLLFKRRPLRRCGDIERTYSRSLISTPQRIPVTVAA